MTQWTRWLYLIAGLAAVFVAVSSGHARDPARQLGAHRYGGLAPGGHRRRLAQHIQALCAAPPRIGRVSAPAAMNNQVRRLRGRIRWGEDIKGGFAST